MLQTQDLRTGQVNEPCIRLTQENSIKNSVQDCLSYILNINGSYFTTLAYSKQLYVCFRANIYSAYYYNIILPESSTIFYHDIWLCNCDVTLNPNPKSPKYEIKFKKIEIRNNTDIRYLLNTSEDLLVISL